MGIDKKTLKLYGIGTSMTICAGLNLNCNAANIKQEKPNLIFIFSDQHSFDMLGCYGNKQIKTPNIDRIASKGVRFNHCISSCPVSTPFRGMLLSGMHPLNNGAITNDVQMLPGNGNYFGEVLTISGYNIGYFGKWHLYGGDRDRPIPPGEHRYGFNSDFLSNNCTLVYDSVRSYYWNEKGEKVRYNEWEPDAQTNQAINFIEANESKPFALFLSWHAPHNWGGAKFGNGSIYGAPKKYNDLYDKEKMQLRKNCEDTNDIRLSYQGYMAMVSNLDYNFGRIMKKLEEEGIAENSIIIFTSDHGDMLESHGWLNNKGCPEIESIKVPLIVKWSKVLEPRTSNLLVGTLDLMPTILGLMGLPVPRTCQGIDHSMNIKSKKDDAAKSVPLFYFPADWRGVYTREYTYSFSLNNIESDIDSPKKEIKKYNVLYNHINDPYELNNLFYSKEYEQQKKELNKLALEWIKKFDDKMIPLKNILPKVMVDEDYFIFTKSPRDRSKNWEGRLKGRPVDYQ